MTPDPAQTLRPRARRLASRVALSAFALVSLGGCETYEIRNGKTYLVSDKKKTDREAALRKLAEENPDDPQVWYQLGDYYERMYAYGQALGCYQKMQVGLERLSKEHKRSYLGGYFRLARVNYHLKQYLEADAYLTRLFKEEPKDLRAASLNRLFREGHLLRAWIYFENGQLKASEEEVGRFRKLGGDARGDHLLVQIDEKLRARDRS